MADPGQQRTASSDPDDDGVRVIPQPGPRVSTAVVLTVLVVVVVATVAAYIATSPASSPSSVGTSTAADTAVATDSQAMPAVAAAPPSRPATRPARRDDDDARPSDSSPGPDDLPSGDPNDLATYVSPTDPEPTAGEVIQALHDIGDHTGIGAFNPPGTSPPLRGLAVPDDFLLPEGYVRHHQVTDDGEPLEPILMFSPDVVFVDGSGREVPIPESRVVPPGMAPPGFPIREIALPPRP